ncbi:MAG: glycosyltransferase [Pirellulales bacterium]|nr:glycosyltransferase [Pirellulales bacterium]
MDARGGRLRVVHVTFGLDVGGLEQLLLEFADAGAARNFDQLFVSLGYSGAVGEELRRRGWPVVCLHRPSGFCPTLATQLMRMVRGIRPDVVHTHDVRALIYGAPAGRFAGAKRVIHTQHGQALGLSNRQRRIAKLAAKAVHRYVCVSRDAATVARDVLQIDEAKLRTIVNGIDLERFVGAEHAPADGDAGPIVAVARLSREKGIDVLLEAVALARTSAPDLRVEIAGDGPCRDELERQCAELDVADCVTFLGQIAGVPDLLRRARAFVLPSRSEGIALTLLEAMASSVPLIATRVGGTPETVVDDQTGVLVPPEDPAALAAALVRLWSDSTERERLATAAKWRAAELYSVDRMVESYERLYRGLELDERQESPAAAEAAVAVAP